MKTGVINISDAFCSGYRIDPSLHLSEGVSVRAKLHKSPYVLSTVEECSSRIFLGSIFSRCFVKSKEFGVTYLSASDTVLANIETGRYLSKKQANQLKYLMLEKDWILVTCSGTLGNVTYTNNNFADKIATHDLIRIVPSDTKYKKGCLYAFLTSKYGYYQITQSQFGGVVKHINDKQLGSIVVPKFPDDFQQEVDELIQESAKLLEEAGDCLHEAETIMNNFIPLKFEKTGFKTKSVSYSNIKDSLQLRIDPPALINNGVEVMARLLSSMESKKIGDLNVKVYRPGIFKRVYVENGFPYIKGGEVFFTNPFRRCVYVSRTKTPFVDEMKLKEGQILIMCAGTVSVGKVKLITKEYEDKNCIGSQDIIRLESEDDLFTKEYLFMYLQLPFVYDYIISMKYGSVIERIEPFHIESIPVITPSKEISKKITSIIKRYMDLSYKAFNAEEKAIKMVEEEIEKWNN